jgi:hypothetical protein
MISLVIAHHASYPDAYGSTGPVENRLIIPRISSTTKRKPTEASLHFPAPEDPAWHHGFVRAEDGVFFLPKRTLVREVHGNSGSRVAYPGWGALAGFRREAAGAHFFQWEVPERAGAGARQV